MTDGRFELQIVMPAEMTVAESHDISLNLQHKVIPRLRCRPVHSHAVCSVLLLGNRLPPLSPAGHQLPRSKLTRTEITLEVDGHGNCIRS